MAPPPEPERPDAASDLQAIADQLLDASDRATMLAPITETNAGFDSVAAYAVLDEITQRRRARGWQPVGRKIGFTNRTIWELFNVDRPMWAPVWRETVSAAAADEATLALESYVQPRIEPEVVFKLSTPVPVTDDAAEVLACVEWMAPGFEVVQCHFPDWRFTIPDCTAAFGLHAALIVGAPVPITDANRASVAGLLPEFEVTLARDGEVVDRGVGANVLGSAALALAHLARVLADQPGAAPLSAGEIVTTGTITNAWPIAPGERWTSDYGRLGLGGLTVTFS
ncbi:MAG: 2-keto-4-pentenoate hydratase [Acidimicrobiales bacterium]